MLNQFNNHDTSCQNGLFHTAAVKRIKDNIGNYTHAELIVLVLS
jgi:hypothetical protein